MIEGQVGIGTQSPDPSAALEIASADKGVLLPNVQLTALNNSVSPVTNPAIGSLVYNTGGTYPKGMYYWNGTNWERWLINDEMDQVLSLRRFGGADASLQPVIIPLLPVTIIPNYISFDAIPLVNTVTGASLAPGGTDINLPAGMYRVDVDFTGNSSGNYSAITGFGNGNTGNSNEFIGQNQLFVIKAGIYDIQGTPLTDIKTYSTVCGNPGGVWIFGVKFSFILNLPAAQTVRLMMNHGAGASDTTVIKAQHNGVMLKFYRFYQF